MPPRAGATRGGGGGGGGGGGPSVQSTTGSRGVRISFSNVGHTMFRGSVKSTGYPLHSPVSPSLPVPASPCAITFQLESTLSTILCALCITLVLQRKFKRIISFG